MSRVGVVVVVLALFGGCAGSTLGTGRSGSGGGSGDGGSGGGSGSCGAGGSTVCGTGGGNGPTGAPDGGVGLWIDGGWTQACPANPPPNGTPCEETSDWQCSYDPVSCCGHTYADLVVFCSAGRTHEVGEDNVCNLGGGVCATGGTGGTDAGAAGAGGSGGQAMGAAGPAG